MFITSFYSFIIIWSRKALTIILISFSWSSSTTTFWCIIIAVPVNLLFVFLPIFGFFTINFLAVSGGREADGSEAAPDRAGRAGTAHLGGGGARDDKKT